MLCLSVNETRRLQAIFGRPAHPAGHHLRRPGAAGIKPAPGTATTSGAGCGSTPGRCRSVCRLAIASPGRHDRGMTALPEDHRLARPSCSRTAGRLRVRHVYLGVDAAAWQAEAVSRPGHSG
jgi:hypothetical protein